MVNFWYNDDMSEGTGRHHAHNLKVWIGGGIAVAVAIVLATIGIGATDSLQSNLAGQFLDDTRDTRCPQGMVFVNAADGFCIDRYEAAPAQECVYADPRNDNETQVNLDMERCLPVSEPGRMPWMFISQHQATLACAKAGKHLATPAEWYAAALGSPADACNTDSGAVIAPESADSCVSASGAQHMVGNAWEWVDAVVIDGELSGRSLPAAGFVAAVDSAGIPLATQEEDSSGMFGRDRLWLTETGPQGVVRGGAFDSGDDAGIYSMYAASPPTLASAGVGFRCAL